MRRRAERFGSAKGLGPIRTLRRGQRQTRLGARRGVHGQLHHRQLGAHGPRFLHEEQLRDKLLKQIVLFDKINANVSKLV